MTSPRIRSLLTDLYAVDPDLKKHEAELIPLIEALLAKRPDMKPTRQFAAKLRKLLAKRAQELSKTSIEVEHSAEPSSFPFFPMKFTYALMGVLVGLLVAVPTAYYFSGTQPLIPPNKSGDALFSYAIEETSPTAFGPLAPLPQDRAMPESAAIGRGGGGGGVGGGGMGMIAPYDGGTVYTYTFAYEGDPLTLEDETVPVLKRVRPTDTPSIALPSLDLIDFGSFPSSTVSNFSLTQKSANGYSIGVNIQDGMIYINRNWDTWDDPLARCEDADCIERYATKMSDVPSDDVVIAAADAFLAKHGIDLTHYGDPVIDDTWRRQNERATLPEERVIPGSIQVTYPLKIDDAPVYEQYGVPMGITVTYDVRLKAVSDIWNLISLNFERSTYPAVSDPKAILDYVDRESSLFAMEQGPNTKVEEAIIRLATPERGYVRIYQTRGNRQEEVYVPALIFPVTAIENAPLYYDRKNVVVPLAKELVEGSSDVPMPVEPLLLEQAE